MKPSGHADQRWEQVASGVSIGLDWGFAGIRAAVMSLLWLVRVSVKWSGRVFRWYQENREQVREQLRRLVGPAQVASGLAVGATAGMIAERALLRTARAEPFVADPTPYGTPSFLDGPDGRIYVHRHGPPELPTVVLVHGWSHSHVVWHKQVRALRDRFHVVTYDQPGHGASSQPAGWSIDVLGRALGAVIQSTASDSVTIAAHSLGGAAVLELAQQDPGFFIGHVRGVVLIGSAASFTDRDQSAGVLARLERKARLGGRLIELRESRLITALSHRSTDASHWAFRLVAFGRSPDPKDVDLAEQLWMDGDPTMINGLARALERWNGRAACQHLPLNTAVITGSRDIVLPPPLAREMAALAGIEDLEVVRGRGHQLHLEAPDEVAETIARVATKGAGDGARG